MYVDNPSNYFVCAWGINAHVWILKSFGNGTEQDKFPKVVDIVQCCSD